MKRIRLDLYAGYVGGGKPDPDNRYSWRQYADETTQEYTERIVGYLLVIIDDLDEESEEGEDDE